MTNGKLSAKGHAWIAYVNASSKAQAAYNAFDDALYEGGDYASMLPDLTQLQREASGLRDAFDRLSEQES